MRVQDVSLRMSIVHKLITQEQAIRMIPGWKVGLREAPCSELTSLDPRRLRNLRQIRRLISSQPPMTMRSHQLTKVGNFTIWVTFKVSTAKSSSLKIQTQTRISMLKMMISLTTTLTQRSLVKTNRTKTHSASSLHTRCRLTWKRASTPLTRVSKRSKRWQKSST